MAGATSLIQLILKKWGDDAAGAARELEERVGFPESVARRIATGELPMDAESVAKRKAEWGGDLEYHGTRANGLLEVDPNRVDLGLHTGPVEQADNRLTQTREWADDVRGETIIPLMVRRGDELSDMRDIGTWNDSISVAKEMDNVGYDSYERLGELELDREFMPDKEWLTSPENRAGLGEFRDALLDDGWDSVRYKNQVENDYGGNGGLRRDIQTQASALRAREKELLELGKSRKPENPMPDVEGMSPDEAETAINAWLESDSKLGTDYHGEGFRYLSDAEKAEVKALQLERAKLGNNPDNFAETRSTITLRPENLRSPNAAFDPEYTGKNIMGNATVPLLGATAAGSAGLLAAPVLMGERGQPTTPEERGFKSWEEVSRDPTAPLPAPTWGEAMGKAGSNLMHVLGLPMTGLQGLARGGYGLLTGEDLTEAAAQAGDTMDVGWKNGLLDVSQMNPDKGADQAGAYVAEKTGDESLGWMAKMGLLFGGL